MQNAETDVYEGGYVEKWGVGGRGYLSVHAKGGFEKPKMIVSCANPALQVSSSSPPKPAIEEEDEDIMPDFEWDVPSDMVQIIEEIVYLNHTQDLRDELPKNFSKKEMDTFYAKIRKQHENIEKDHQKELDAFEQKRLRARRKWKLSGRSKLIKTKMRRRVVRRR